MNNIYSNKAEICYKDACARFHGKNAEYFTAVFSALMILTLVFLLVKNFK